MIGRRLRFWRDVSGRLTIEWRNVASDGYAALRDEIAKAFDLTSRSLETVGLDVVFQDFSKDGAVLGIGWDNWTGFTVFAKGSAAEPLLHEVAKYLESRGIP